MKISPKRLSLLFVSFVFVLAGCSPPDDATKIPRDSPALREFIAGSESAVEGLENRLAEAKASRDSLLGMDDPERARWACNDVDDVARLLVQEKRLLAIAKARLSGIEAADEEPHRSDGVDSVED